MYTPTVDKYPDGLVSHPTAEEQIKQGNQGHWWILRIFYAFILFSTNNLTEPTFKIFPRHRLA